jgi:hypothetical protein
MSLLLHKTQINWNNCSKKTQEKIAFATVAVLMLLPSRLLNQPQPMKRIL